MTEREQAVIDGIRDMERDATGVGLCPIAFSTIREEMERIIAERDALMTRFEECAGKESVL